MEDEEQQQRRPVFFTCISGLIGVGKTTVMQACERLVAADNGNSDVEYKFIYENVEAWMVPLDRFYRAPTAHNCWLLIMSVLSAYQRVYEEEILRAADAPDSRPLVIIMERCIVDSKLFTELNRTLLGDGRATHLHLTIEHYIDAFPFTVPDLWCYLTADARVCWQRMRDRDRAAERVVAIDYLTRLETEYERFMCTSTVRFDTSDTDAESTAQRLLDTINERRRRRGGGGGGGGGAR